MLKGIHWFFKSGGRKLLLYEEKTGLYLLSQKLKSLANSFLDIIWHNFKNPKGAFNWKRKGPPLLGLA